MRSDSICSTVLALMMSIGAAAWGAETRVGRQGFLFDAHVPLDKECVAAIARAQKWLAESQRPDGSWHTTHGRNNAGVISYAILALMTGGDVPGEGQYAKQIGLGVQYLLNVQQESGLICARSETHGAMYQHALSTLVLSEVYGMSENPRIRTALIKAINLIVSTQHTAGGWRYHPRIEKGDISITVMQVMALRSASEAGIYVPDDTMERAVRFIKKCFIPAEGGFGYTGPSGGAYFARSAAGIVSLQTVGLHDDPIIPRAIRYIMTAAFDSERNRNHYWYGQYYSSVALYHYGGEAWKTYYPRIKKKILTDWKTRGHYPNVLDTSWAVLVLGVPYRYLPIYQR